MLWAPLSTKDLEPDAYVFRIPKHKYLDARKGDSRALAMFAEVLPISEFERRNPRPRSPIPMEIVKGIRAKMAQSAFASAAVIQFLARTCIPKKR